METVNHILEHKGSQIWNISPDATVYDALKIMANKDIGALLVMDAWKLLGIFSERDYARKLVLKGKSSKESKVQDFMTKVRVTVNPDTDIVQCMALMTEQKVRHLPVMSDNEVVGVISIGDVVNSIIKEQDYTIKNLKDYITGYYH